MKKYLILVVCLVLFWSCANTKQVPYMQNSELIDYSNNILPLHEVRIMPNDYLIIHVNSDDPDAAAPFNPVEATKTYTFGNQSSTLTGNRQLKEYYVYADGYINFPECGKVQVAGKTVPECQALIQDLIKGHFKESPIVTVEITSFQVAVLGDVTRPGVFKVNTTKNNVLEVLAQAGDLQISGKRCPVKIVRIEANGLRAVHEIDLKDPMVMNSPYFYVQQNDVIYVTPSKTKAKDSQVGATTSYWLAGISVAISIASLLVSVLK